MSAVDFEAWAAPGLILSLGGKTYTVEPPSVEAAKQVLAAAIRGEVNLGLVKEEIPAEVQKVLDSIGEGSPALGATYRDLVSDGVAQVTIDRMSYYAVFYWARGKEYADSLAKILWTPRADENSGQPAPKG